MEKSEKISVPSYGGPRNDRRISIDHLTDEEHDKMLGSMKGGMWYIRVVDGRLEAIPNYKQLPDPIEDTEMLPFWRKATKNEMGTTYAIFEMEPIEEISSMYASITIQSLCGYYYSAENYKIEAEKLNSYGFECLRSRRGDDGKFSEIWFLTSISFSKGELKNYFQKAKDEKTKLSKALEFLRKKVTFGSLDVSIQRLAMPMPD